MYSYLHTITQHSNFKYIFFMLIMTIALLPDVKAKENTVMKEKIIIVTPYPEKFTNHFRRAFENLHSGYETQILKMKTNEGIDLLQQSKDENAVDLYWASSLDAFKILKADNLLETYRSSVQGIPKKVAGFPVNDTDNTYSGFAFSGVGLMWNERLLDSKGVAIPADWEDLAKPSYFGLVGMSSPSRSGTTHVAIENILQTRGWKKGWSLIQDIGGNLIQVTKKSGHVPTGVNNGQFGVGIVIDYYGLSSRARHFPVNFTYPQPAAMFPANIALVKNAPHQKGAQLFIDFILSLEGQHLLLHKDIRRLPIRLETYSSAPDGYPNPFLKESIGHTYVLDFERSKNRYKLVNSIFDNLVTFNLSALVNAKSAIIKLENKLSKTPNSAAMGLLKQAKAELHWSPVSEAESLDSAYAGKFTKKRTKKSDTLPAHQKELEDSWDVNIKMHYKRALDLANKGMKMQ